MYLSSRPHLKNVLRTEVDGLSEAGEMLSLALLFWKDQVSVRISVRMECAQQF